MIGNNAQNIPVDGDATDRRDLRIYYPISEVGHLLGDLPDRVVRGLVERGELRSMKIAGHRVVPHDAIAEFAAKRNTALPAWFMAWLPVPDQAAA